jgi:hypothetical protein
MGRSFAWLTGLGTLCVAVFVLVSRHVVAQRKNAIDAEIRASAGWAEESAFGREEYHGLRKPYLSYPCLPRRIHLSQATDVVRQENEHYEVSMTVSFSLDRLQCDHATPFVHYGHDMFEEKRATGERQHFNFTSSVTGEHFESDWLYHVTLPSLRANTRYWYHIQVMEQSSAEIGRRLMTADTPYLSLRTPPLPGSPTTIALVGDLGQTENSTRTMAHILRATSPPNPVSLVMIVGDMSYADSDPHRWTRWLDLMEPLFRSTPLHVAAGNHEIECDNVTHQAFIQYEHYFQNPNRIGAPEMEPISDDYRNKLWNHSCSTPSEFLGHYNYGNSFYAFRHGLVHMIVLNSYTDSTAGSAQYEWLLTELLRVDRTVTPWLIVSFHAPMYNTFRSHVNETEATLMQQAMEPLFVESNVNLVLSGHVHAYMRTHPLRFGKVTAKSPIYVIVGAGGNREGHADGYQHDEPEAWVAKRDDDEYGYGHLHLQNASHTHWSWVRDGTTTEGIRDHVWITNPHV